MKKLSIAVGLAIAVIVPVHAMTLEGEVEKFAVIEQPKPEPPPAPAVELPPENGHVGVRISSFGSVDYVHPDSPAAAAGLEKGDRVLLVDGHKHWINKISGEPGTTVHLQVKRHHDIFEVDLTRVRVSSINP